MGPFKSLWDPTEVRAQSWYKVRTYDLVNTAVKSILQVCCNVLQFVAVCCSVLQRVAVGCLQCRGGSVLRAGTCTGSNQIPITLRCIIFHIIRCKRMGGDTLRLG